MPLAPGAQVGPYVVVEPVGFGGMGEVYRARDGRLARDVALKVLPAEVASDADRLRRFKQEARAAGSLSDPHLVTVFDSGLHDGAPYLVFELLEGETLRARLASGPLPLRRALELGSGIAAGLAAAHEKGIVHRDLKPENVFVSRDGRPKILDFGLAKLRHVGEGAAGSDVATRSRLTSPGTVLGTLGYMSPEQLEGREADPRSDIFALGLLLHEALSGRHPFERDSLEATLTAVLTRDPPPLGLDSAEGSTVEHIVARCLEKRPEARFQSARDLAFALNNVMPFPRSSSEALRKPRSGTPRGLALAAAVAAALAGMAAAFWLGRATGAAPPLEEFQRLTFRRGDVRSARFAPDGQTIVYSAAWGGGNDKLYTTRLGSPESRALDLPDAALLAMSSAGEMAICLGQTSHVIPGGNDCTLARVALAGGAPRPVLEHVRSADFSPDGRELAVIRRADRDDRLEYPPGKVLVEGDGLSHVRISPSGEWVAFMARSGTPDRAIEVVRRDGTQRTTLAQGYYRGFGLAWSPDSTEVWTTTSDGGGIHLSLYALDLRGRRRLVVALPALANILDVDREGRALLSIGDLRGDVVAWPPGEPRERLLSWLEFPRSLAFSPDGRTLYFSEIGQGAGPSGAAVYARGIAGGPAVRLGDGFALDVSPDGRLVAALARSRGGFSRELLAIPTGPGETRSLYSGELECQDARWLPSGDALLVAGRQPSRPVRLWVVREGAAPRPVTPEGFGAGVPAPGGVSFVAQRPSDGALLLFDSASQEGRVLPGGPEPGRLERVTPDGRSLVVAETLFPGSRILRRDIATGERTLIRELQPEDPTGIVLFRGTFSPSGDTFAALYVRASTALFLARGLR
ncbi:MAG TPA: protein kinase [Vicinamibacteria bacterium]|nr:protein kinase [Vicinamibacteria bacterium]